tara:strand:- start:67 stop:429 length:363 start_codon:yes stop_codon:yes gene_type:complete
MNLRLSKPIFIENSKIPVWLSYLSPIDIGAITLGPFVISRGLMSETTKNHETIHWQQYIETAIIGFLLLYLFYWLIGLIKYRDGRVAYYQIPFEQEAYKHEDNPYYVICRKRWGWRKFKI